MDNYIKGLRDNSLLSHISENPSVGDRANGIILLACGDCDKFPELLEYERSLFLKHGQEPRIHLLALNGGGLLLSPRCPLNADCQTAQSLLSQIKDSAVLKKITEVVIYGHHPCGAAGLANLSLEQSMEWLALGADRVGSMLKNLRVTCNFHHECNADTRFKSDYFRHSEWLRSRKQAVSA